MKTEQDIIDGNIKLHNYFTDAPKGKFYGHRYNATLDEVQFWYRDNGFERLVGVKYHNKHGFYNLWQVLQKVDKDENLYKWANGEYSEDAAQRQKFMKKYWYGLYMVLTRLIDDKADPIQIFWAAVELIKEFKKWKKENN